MPVYDQTALDMSGEAGSTIGSATIVSQFEAFRVVFVLYLNAYPVKLRGPDKVAEID